MYFTFFGWGGEKSLTFILQGESLCFEFIKISDNFFIPFCEKGCFNLKLDYSYTSLSRKARLERAAFRHFLTILHMEMDNLSPNGILLSQTEIHNCMLESKKVKRISLTLTNKVSILVCPKRAY